jgi:hypothetical protein
MPPLLQPRQPLVCEFLQVALYNSGRSQVLLCHGFRRNEKQHSLNPGIPFSLFFPLSIPLSFSDVGKEVKRERWIVRENAGVREGDHQLL